MSQKEAAQEEKLVWDKIPADYLEIPHQPRRSWGCFKWALITVMGLIIVALVNGFILYHIFYSQEVELVKVPAEVNMSLKLKERNALGQHDIFTAERFSVYLIYGWVKFTETTGEPLTLTLRWKQDSRTHQQKNLNQTEIFFFEKAQMANNMTISLQFKSKCSDSLFHVYELGAL